MGIKGKLWAMLLLAFGLTILVPIKVRALTLNTDVNGKYIRSFTSTSHENLFLPKDADLTKLSINSDTDLTATTAGTLNGSRQLSGDFSGVTDFVLTLKGGTKWNIRLRKSCLPALCLTLNGTTLDKVNAGSKETKYQGNSVHLTDADHAEYEVDARGNVEFKGRGNSTWRGWAKKPYQIKFDTKTGMLGMPKAKKWILLANARDYSQMQNYLAYNLAGDIGSKVWCQSRFVDFFVDGKYIGVYQLTQKADTNSSMADMESKNGVICELDTFYYAEEPNRFTSGTKGYHFVLKEHNGDTDAEGVQGMNYFKQKINAFEKALYAASPNWNTICQYIDPQSWAEYYWVEEFTMNGDAMRTSAYFYMDGNGDVIHAGPAWDFDWAFRLASTNTNAIWMNGDYTYRASYFKHLVQIPQFSALVKEVYQKQVSPALRKMITSAGDTRDAIAASADLNRIKWSLDYSAYSNYKGYCNTLISWIKSRYNYLEGKYGAAAAITFTKTEYMLPRAGLDKDQLKFDLVVKGADIPETNTAVRSQVVFNVKRIAGFEDANLANLTVAQINAGGAVTPLKSGVLEVTASYNGVTSTNKAVILVPGDNNRDGKVSVRDITLMMKYVRDDSDKDDGSYDRQLCDMNGDGKITAKDAMTLASMIRGRLTYTN